MELSFQQLDVLHDPYRKISSQLEDISQGNFMEKYRFLTNKHEEMLGHFNFEYKLEELESNFFAGIEFLRSFVQIDSEFSGSSRFAQ